MTGFNSEDGRGIMSRTVEKMIKDIMNMKESGWNMILKASMLEVYNETVKDIISNMPDNNVLLEHESHTKHRINFSNGKVTVSDIKWVEIDTSSVTSGMKKLSSILDIANNNRSFASTAMNERSSRSHVLFYLDAVGYHPGLNTTIEGGLRLVDLAGSERLDRAGTASDQNRFRETVNINKSLSSLGEVFMSLGSKSAHVPYRNSKLTMLLQVCSVI
jgi:kinesin family protein C1